MNNNISFVLFTYNEEKRIACAVRNFIKYGNVYVFDGGSTDKTQEISEQLGAKFYLRPLNKKPQVETQENFDFIKSKINTDWIYWGYVDNIAPKSLIDKLLSISFQDKIKMVLIPLYTYLWGNTRYYAQKGYSPMFFHKDYLDFSNNGIHGMGKFTGNKNEIYKLPNKSEFALVHFSVYNISKFVQGHLKYAEEEAVSKIKEGKKFSLIRMLAAMVRYCGIYGRIGYKNGVLGLIIMLSYAFSRFMVYVRLYELENDITLESIEKNYSIVKEQILSDQK